MSLSRVLRNLCISPTHVPPLTTGTMHREYIVAVMLVFTTAIPGDSTNGGSPVGVANANNYADTEVLSQHLQLPVHSVRNEIYVPGC